MIRELYQLRGEARRMKYATCDHVGRLLSQRDQFDADPGPTITFDSTHGFVPNILLTIPYLLKLDGLPEASNLRFNQNGQNTL